MQQSYYSNGSWIYYITTPAYIESMMRGQVAEWVLFPTQNSKVDVDIGVIALYTVSTMQVPLTVSSHYTLRSISCKTNVDGWITIASVGGTSGFVELN